MRVDVYEQLLRDILDRVLPPGEPLIELSLAERYKVSRTPVREALRKLLADGLVEQYSRGYRVSKHSPEDILDIYEVRIALEEAAARSAASRRTPFDLAKLRRSHQAMIDAGTHGLDELAAATHGFHLSVWDASHNSILISTLVSLQRRLWAFSSSTLSVPGRPETSLAEHFEILRAIEEGDASEAGRLAAEHMTRSRDIRLELYSEKGAPGPRT